MAKTNQDTYQIKNEIKTPENLSTAEKAEFTAEVLIEKIKGFYQQYKKIIGYSVVGVLVLVGGYIAYGYYLDSLNQQAQTQMMRAIQYFEKDSLDKALKGDGAYPGFETIIEEYSGTSSANLARYYYGIILLKKGKFEEGLEQLEAFDKPNNNAMSAAAYAAMAYAYEELNQPEKAASHYELAARIFLNNQTTPFYLLLAGENYEAANQPKTAIAVYQEIINNYPLSAEKQKAEKAFYRLSD